MRCVTILLHRFFGFFSLITGIGAKVLLRFPTWFPHPVFQDSFDLRDIMSVCSGYDDRQRDTMLVDQNVTFASIFFPDPWGCVPRIPERSEPLSCSRRCSAISRQCLPLRHIRPAPFSKASRTIPLSPISESIDEHCWNCRIPSAGLSIGFLYGEQIRSPQKPCAFPLVFALHRVSSDMFCSDPASASESAVLLSTRIHR